MHLDLHFDCSVPVAAVLLVGVLYYALYYGWSLAA
jgi:hypothetical protein